MKLVAFQPSEKWDSLKRNAILMVTLGIVIVFGVLLFVLPVSSMRSISSAGRKMTTLLQKSVNTGVKTTYQVMQITSDTIKTTSGVVTGGLSEIAEKAELTIKFMVDIIHSIHRAFGKSVRFTIRTLQQLTEAVSKTSEFVVRSLSATARMVIETSQKTFETSMKTLWKTQEFMTDAIEYCFVPALENYLKTTFDLAKVGVDVYQKYLPRVVRYMHFFGQFSVGIATGQATGQVFMAFVNMIPYIFSETITIGSTGLRNAVVGIGSAIRGVIPAFVSSLQDLVGNICEPIVNLVNGTIDFFPTLPVGVDLDDCSTEFIAMALKLMTRGSVCGGEKYPDTVSKFAGCMFNKIENITLFPGFSSNYSPSALLDIMGIGTGGVDYIGELLNKVPNIQITIPSFTLGGILGSLNDILLNLATKIETFVFSEMVRLRKSVVSVVSEPGVDLTLPEMIFQLLFRVITEAASVLGQHITGILDSIPICDLFDVCYQFDICENICEVVEFFGIECNLSCSPGEVCLLSSLGVGCNDLKNSLRTAIFSVLGFSPSISDPLIDGILGTLSEGEGSW